MVGICLAISDEDLGNYLHMAWLIVDSDNSLVPRPIRKKIFRMGLGTRLIVTTELYAMKRQHVVLLAQAYPT